VALAQTLAERVLVHLKAHPVPMDAADVPGEITQEGIADTLGAQVAHESRALKTLEMRGHVTARLAHPRGSRRRSRAYTLTPEGRAKAAGLTMPPDPIAVPTPASKPPGQVPIRIPAGRAAQARILTSALDEAAKGALRIVLVEGDAGMGKSRLLAAFAEEARARGALVLSGTGTPTGEEQILGPLTSALEPLAFERRFRAHTAGSPRERALAAAIESLEAGSRVETLALIIDDVHLAGASVAEFLHGLVVGLAQTTRLLLVVAFRREEAWRLPNGPLYTALTPIRQLEGARHVSLPALDVEGIARLLEDAAAHHVTERLVERIARESGGNPLYALAMADAMLDGVDEADFFPASVRALATNRFTGLGPTEHAVLQAAAVCGPGFDYHTLARLHEGTEPPLIAALDVLLDRLLLEEVAAGHDALQLRFTHPKIREAVLDEMSSTRRRWLEGRLASAAQRT
jgi:predicted ATPase